MLDEAISTVQKEILDCSYERDMEDIICKEKHHKLCQIGKGNNPMVGMTVAVAVSIEEAAKAGNF